MNQIEEVKKWLDDADAVIVTAGNGFAQMEGLDMLSEEGFEYNYPQISPKYHVHTIADALDKKFDSWDEQWDFWSKLIKQYSLDYEPSPEMQTLVDLLQGKNYFIATSTYGHFFEKAGFDENRIFNVFGDWTRMQCSSGLNHGQVSDVKAVQDYVAGCGQVPKCEDCNSEMELHMPLNEHFFPDGDANTRFRWFLTRNEDQKVVVLELGVDLTSPQLLEPMVKLVEQFGNWKYIAADLSRDELPDSLKNRGLGLNIGSKELLEKMK
ncbi:NAD-dependent SIR2 family protein deacetylase [Lactobacillus colini]|uniref:NAD-dependent SIR2 family protein deacetylase n=1 Tax=Lactobacillus colini TaxID=1819254 RepID=A0ABS4MFC7_9LACO|nr:Sir2 family NAD-dependent protein deacetylase [Lactobacillus colini]MBP2058067.1 NAD-dependent SIR2 family protein deacetylase [Lactobacillus colini]